MRASQTVVGVVALLPTICRRCSKIDWLKRVSQNHFPTLSLRPFSLSTSSQLFEFLPKIYAFVQSSNTHANSFVSRHQLSRKIHFRIKHSTDTSRIRLTSSWRDPSVVPAKAMPLLRARALATEPHTTPMEATAATIPLLVHPPMAKMVPTGPMVALRSAREDTERVHQLPPLRRGPVV